MTTPTTPAGQPGPIRRILTAEDLHRLRTAIHDAANDVGLLRDTTKALHHALTRATGPATDTGAETAAAVHPDRYAIPTSQWTAILSAAMNRAGQWGTAVEIGAELGANRMPRHYDDPTVPEPDLGVADSGPVEYRLTLTREATTVIYACRRHLDALEAFYGAGSPVHLDALRSWNLGVTFLLGLNAGADTRVVADGPLSLFASSSSGLCFALAHHGVARRCTTEGCHAAIDDHGAARPAYTGAAVRDHHHTPSYPIYAPHPATWSLHS